MFATDTKAAASDERPGSVATSPPDRRRARPLPPPSRSPKRQPKKTRGATYLQRPPCRGRLGARLCLLAMGDLWEPTASRLKRRAMEGEARLLGRPAVREGGGWGSAMDVKRRWATDAARPGSSGREITMIEPKSATASGPESRTRGRGQGGARGPQPLSAATDQGASPNKTPPS